MRLCEVLQKLFNKNIIQQQDYLINTAMRGPKDKIESSAQMNLDIQCDITQPNLIVVECA